MSKQNDIQQITKAKGRPMLTWVGKHPLERVEWYPAQEKEVYGIKNSTEFNKLFWGDNLQVLSHLLKDYRGKIDLIYIDPPFDSKADYVRKVKVRGERVEGIQEGILEEKQYTDIWENDEYLQFMYERLLLMKELLTETGSVYLHCDWHKSHYLRLIMDEIFGEDNFVNEIIWQRKSATSFARKQLGITNDTILWYSKSQDYTFNPIYSSEDENTKKYIKERFIFDDGDGRKYMKSPLINPLDRPNLKYVFMGINPPPTGWLYSKARLEELYKKNELLIPKDHNMRIYRKIYLDEYQGQLLQNIWRDIPIVNPMAIERSDYPTQKPEALLDRIIGIASNEGDLILDCFAGSGTTMAVAQRLGRKWIGCDINTGAIQTSTKRLAQIIEEQEKSNQKLIKDDFKGLMAFKIYNVNDYDIFKNEIEAKEIVMEMYGIEPIKRSQFDGVLDSKFVKIMPLNKVLNKLDIKTALKNIEDAIDTFTPKTTSKGSEEIYEEGVIIICSGAELDAEDYLNKENKTGVKVIIRDILNDKKSLIFKKKPEARIEVKAKDKKLSVVIKEFYSPILMRKLELENEKIIDKKTQAKVEDFKQIIDSVAIDVDYDGKLFNAEIIDLPDKKELIKAEYSYTYEKSGKNTVAIKIVDVLGEEYFETFEIIA